MEKSKDIKDYLHYYLGCEGFTKQPYGTEPGISIKDIKSRLLSVDVKGELRTQCYDLSDKAWDSLTCVMASDFTPFLRPLSDMSGKEVIEAFHLAYADAKYQFEEFQKVDNNEFGWRARNQNGMECFLPANTFTPDVFHYLLSKHFDLFGLIESGLAIDKTKQP